jgi:hypothetical protein
MRLDERSTCLTAKLSSWPCAGCIRHPFDRQRAIGDHPERLAYFDFQGTPNVNRHTLRDPNPYRLESRANRACHLTGYDHREKATLAGIDLDAGNHDAGRRCLR